MKLTAAEEAKIKAYLNAIGANLTGPERTETLADLESHIYEAIAARADSGESAGIVEAVIAEMDSPETYSSSMPASQSGICGLSIFGTILLPFGLPVLWHVISLTPVGEHWDKIEFFKGSFYRFLILPIGIIAMLLGPILGAMSIKRIKQSKGSISGGLLAVLNAIFYPVLLLWMLLAIIATNIILRDGNEIAVGIPIVLIGFLIWNAINLIIYRMAYKCSGLTQN